MGSTCNYTNVCLFWAPHAIILSSDLGERQFKWLRREAEDQLQIISVTIQVYLSHIQVKDGHLSGLLAAAPCNVVV